MRPLIECVANFSEGQRESVIVALIDAIQGVPSVHVLDRHSDSDHNRTVLTFAGAPEAVAEAAFRAVAVATQQIDLEAHRGVHPRLGAADVVPFVPLRGITLAGCVQLAHTLGRRVGEQLGIPVYLYEAAALRSERKRLENVRRGQYEALKTAIGNDPDRAPDFGPHRLGTAGATIIGARDLLIAYNIVLDTADVSIAKRIAAAVRESSGGLAGVKALGLSAHGQAQVSMNITDFRRSPMAQVIAVLRAQAAQHNTAIYKGELVGLIPQAALAATSFEELSLPPETAAKVLEVRLRAVGEALP